MKILEDAAVSVCLEETGVKQRKRVSKSKVLRGKKRNRK